MKPQRWEPLRNLWFSIDAWCPCVIWYLTSYQHLTSHLISTFDISPHINIKYFVFCKPLFFAVISVIEIKQCLVLQAVQVYMHADITSWPESVLSFDDTYSEIQEKLVDWFSPTSRHASNLGCETCALCWRGCGILQRMVMCTCRLLYKPSSKLCENAAFHAPVLDRRGCLL